jgi:hypothetical protein
VVFVTVINFNVTWAVKKYLVCTEFITTVTISVKSGYLPLFMTQC